MLKTDWFRFSPTKLSLAPFDGTAKAIDLTSNLYKPQLNYYELGPFGDYKFSAAPIQVHLFVITGFIAVISPFGALLFSVLKRALKQEQLGKTFVNGGVIDRADCFLVVGFFLFIYVNFIVYKTEDAVKLMQEMIMQLSPESQKTLYAKLLAQHNTNS